MNGNEITVGVAVSIMIVVGICGFWIWVVSKLRRPRTGLPMPDRSCNRDWYSATADPDRRIS